jgi:uncharacterized membrane protein YuzA (DUF378 family)
MSGHFWHPTVDFLTLVLIVLAGVELGLIGAFNFSLVTWLFGSWHRIAYDVIGVSAIWQMARQRFL